MSHSVIIRFESYMNHSVIQSLFALLRAHMRNAYIYSIFSYMCSSAVRFRIKLLSKRVAWHSHTYI